MMIPAISDGMTELIAAVDDLARVGQLDRSDIARNLAAIVRKRANFETLRTKLDPRFGDVPALRRGD